MTTLLRFLLNSTLSIFRQGGQALPTRLRSVRIYRVGTKPRAHPTATTATAFAQREDRIRALTAGFQMHVTKPVAPEELIVVIDTMMART